MHSNIKIASGPSFRSLLISKQSDSMLGMLWTRVCRFSIVRPGQCFMSRSRKCNINERQVTDKPVNPTLLVSVRLSRWGQWFVMVSTVESEAQRFSLRTNFSNLGHFDMKDFKRRNDISKGLAAINSANRSSEPEFALNTPNDRSVRCEALISIKLGHCLKSLLYRSS